MSKRKNLDPWGGAPAAPPRSATDYSIQDNQTNGVGTIYFIYLFYYYDNLFFLHGQVVVVLVSNALSSYEMFSSIINVYN